jgi:hypothetical protein
MSGRARDGGAGARTFSDAIVWITSSGGVPRSSVMIENWFTSARRAQRGASRRRGRKARTVLAGEERLALEHLREDAADGPDVDRDVVLLPREHDLRRAVVPRRDVARHLWVLDAREPKVADLAITH